MSSSRIKAFYRLTIAERRQRLADALGLSAAEVEALNAADALPLEVADIMVENAVGTFALPFGVALNFQVNGRDHVIPMVVEEPSVLAAASNPAAVARPGGGLAAEDLTPGLCRRGAGPRDVEVRLVRTANHDTMVVVHVLLDTGDAMGANAVNSLVEGLAPLVAEIAGGTPCLRILSNLADRRLARAAVRIPFAALARDGMDGPEVAERMLWAYEFAANDPYRAATHNKGIMNGIDALAIATGNDWRAIEAGAHAYAARGGAYGSLSTWEIEDGHLVGAIELPMAVSTVGPLVQSHPRVRLALRILNVASARELAAIMAAVGLASNLGAMRALATEGIQKGHMALHARAVSHAAGARGAEAEELRQRLLAAGEVKIDRARELLRALESRS